MTTSRLQLSIGQFSDRGAKPVNEDCYGVHVPDEPLLTTKGAAMVIADGISASESARLAAEYAVKGFLSDYFATPESWTVKHSVEKVLIALNRWLYAQGAQYADPRHGLVTTFSALVLKSTTAHVFHIGDTRIHQLRDDTLEPLTRDHHVWVDAGRTYLNRALGVDLHLDIDYRALPVELGDIYLFTSDGVHEYLPLRELKRLLSEHTHNLDLACARIVASARAAGSPDNLTCQAVRVDALPAQDADSVFRSLRELPFPPELEPGMVLDGYRILRELHASPASQLYLALDEASGSQVVLKTPSVNFEDDLGYLERFRHEEWVGRRIQHPHVLRVIEPPRRRRFLYHVLEYLEGHTLRQWMAEHPRPALHEVRAILGQIARGLRAFHRLEMLHLDLKPENIHIDRHGTLRIIDFGSVKIAGIHEIASPVPRSDLVGTRHYTAPELLRGEPATPRTDLYALGVIAYELLTGHLPYGALADGALDARRLARLRYIPARRHRPELPVWVDGALEKAVHPDPQRRYGVETEFLYDLEHPNPAFAASGRQPLIERHPLGFWQALALLSLLANLLLLYWLHRG
ncbi:MAG TPA: bifunctional protein-serine/threonine kinase/phosphatase [Candidatus Competibacteraceae bacterium]|nr:bifunctional protein-serine/threonine kinase/phosphatase [Candidatus Competibacteraceae bacterium]